MLSDLKAMTFNLFLLIIVIQFYLFVATWSLIDFRGCQIVLLALLKSYLVENLPQARLRIFGGCVKMIEWFYEWPHIYRSGTSTNIIGICRCIWSYSWCTVQDLHHVCWTYTFSPSSFPPLSISHSFFSLFLSRFRCHQSSNDYVTFSIWTLCSTPWLTSTSCGLILAAQ